MYDYHLKLQRANSINPKFVTLNESRGIESEEHKLFMRLSGEIYFGKEKKFFFVKTNPYNRFFKSSSLR